MAAKNPAVGDQYRLKRDFGDGPGYLHAGTVVTVTGIHPPGTPGLGLVDKDTVTAEFKTMEGAVRTIALTVPEFTELFQKVANAG